MVKIIKFVLVFLAVYWGITYYALPTFFIKSNMLNKIQNTENMKVIPKGEFPDIDADFSYIKGLRQYSLEGLSLSIPSEYQVHSSKEGSMVFRIGSNNVIMIIRSNVAGLNSKLRDISGRVTKVDLGDTYTLMKKALYFSPDKFVMGRLELLYFIHKAGLLAGKEKVLDVYEYKTENLKGFIISSQMGDYKVKRFEMFSGNNDWITVMFINTELSQREMDSIVTALSLVTNNS